MDASNARQPLPFYLVGAYAPASEERTLYDLEVIGQVPHDLQGIYMRNGPNPRGGTSPAWFAGEGMLHGVRFAEGKAVWYRNRWMRREFGPNTSVVQHGGRILSLVETQPPLEVDAELATVGTFDFGGALQDPMSAHPKVCPVTGELLFMSYQLSAPYLTFYRVDAQGRVVHRAPINVPGATFFHDIAITERFVVFWDQPVQITDWRSAQPLRWLEDHRARIGVLPRDGDDEDVRWFDIAPCSITHTMNAHEEGKHVMLDVSRGPRLMTAQSLYRYTLDLETGRVSERVLAPPLGPESTVDFPRIAPGVEGRPYRYGYALDHSEWSTGSWQRTVSRKFDVTTGGAWVHDFGPSRMAGEWVIVPRANGAEDDAWALSFVYDHARGASDLVILDARRFDEPPVATVRLPCRVPVGIHGAWIADEPCTNVDSR